MVALRGGTNRDVRCIRGPSRSSKCGFPNFCGGHTVPTLLQLIRMHIWVLGTFLYVPYKSPKNNWQYLTRGENSVSYHSTLRGKTCFHYKLFLILATSAICKKTILSDFDNRLTACLCFTIVSFHIFLW